MPGMEKKMITRSLPLALLVGVLTITGGAFLACTTTGGAALPLQLEDKLATGATADDHLAAAALYHRAAEKETALAEKYERRAEAIAPLMDTKGFRRAGLRTAAQTHRKEAKEMEHLYAVHQQKALAMMGQQERN